jgi:hypothetical protein
LAAPSAGAKVACTLEKEEKRARARERERERREKREGKRKGERGEEGGRRCRGSRGLLAAFDGFILHFHGGTMGRASSPDAAAAAGSIRSLLRSFGNWDFSEGAQSRSTRSRTRTDRQFINFGKFREEIRDSTTARRRCRRRAPSGLDTRNYRIISREEGRGGEGGGERYQG